MTTREMLAEIRAVISKCDEDEKDVLDALLGEAETWKDRFEELECPPPGEYPRGV